LIIHFCPLCGTPTIRRYDGGRERDACPSCGWVHYSEMAVGVGALVLRGERVLLVERGIPPVGRWTLPSGWIEQEETLETAVRRELKEETALDGRALGVICIRNIPKMARNELYVCLLCEVAPDVEPVPDGEESTQARFVHPSEFDSLDLSLFSRFVVERYLALRPQPWPLTADFPYREAYPDAAIFSPF